MDPVSVRKDGAVFHLAMDRADALNTIDDEMADALVAAMTEAATDTRVRVLVLSGNGRGFSAGGDLGSDPKEWVSRPEPGHYPAVRAILSIPKPVVARVHGCALGAGLDLALACDLRIVTRSAVLGAIGARAGAAEGMALLTSTCGRSRAQELVLLGERFSGRRAVEWGLFHRAVARDALDQVVGDVATRLATGPTAILGAAKAALRAPVEDALSLEVQACRDSLQTLDSSEAHAAHREGRPPRFSGR
jgi:2-(1,2-epoxy-1,2-dihydrophenyl)acetyl-CoA isomerase